MFGVVEYSEATRSLRTLNSSRRGSMRVNCRSLGRPPTLWWLFIVWLCFCLLPGGGQDSITSGYRVPWVQGSQRSGLLSRPARHILTSHTMP